MKLPIFRERTPTAAVCHRCGEVSPIVFLESTDASGKKLDRSIEWWNQKFADGIDEFGWRVEKSKCYCPDCKGLGASS